MCRMCTRGPDLLLLAVLCPTLPPPPADPAVGDPAQHPRSKPPGVTALLLLEKGHIVVVCSVSSASWQLLHFLFCLSTSTDAAPDQKQACAILRTLESLLAVRHRFAVLLPARPSGACCSQLPWLHFASLLVVSRHGPARGPGDIPGGSPSLLAGRLRLSLPCAGLCVASASAVCEASLLAAWSFSWTTSCEDNWLYCTRRRRRRWTLSFTCAISSSCACFGPDGWVQWPGSSLPGCR